MTRYDTAKGLAEFNRKHPVPSAPFTEADFDPEECEHESVDSRDEADGVAFGGASHHEVNTCLNCGANLIPSERDEDGEWHWEVEE
jgi:hypothetical protein